MSPDLPYHIPLAGVAALILLYFVISSWKFGVVRPIASTLSLAAGAGAAFFLFHNADPFLEAIRIGSNFSVALGLSIGIGALVFLVLRKFVQGVSERASDSDGPTRHIMGGPVGAILSLIPALLLIAGLATGLRRIATMAELEYIGSCTSLYASGESIYPDTPYSTKLCAALESIPRSAAFFDRIDPSCQIAKRHLVGLGLISRQYDLYLSIGRRNRVANEIYSHPRVTTLLGAIPVTKLLDARNYPGLLANGDIRETSDLPGLSKNLEDIGVIEALQEALGMD